MFPHQLTHVEVIKQSSLTFSPPAATTAPTAPTSSTCEQRRYGSTQQVDGGGDHHQQQQQQQCHQQNCSTATFNAMVTAPSHHNLEQHDNLTATPNNNRCVYGQMFKEMCGGGSPSCQSLDTLAGDVHDLSTTVGTCHREHNNNETQPLQQPHLHLSDGRSHSIGGSSPYLSTELENSWASHHNYSLVSHSNCVTSLSAAAAAPAPAPAPLSTSGSHQIEYISNSIKIQAEKPSRRNVRGSIAQLSKKKRQSTQQSVDHLMTIPTTYRSNTVSNNNTPATTSDFNALSKTSASLTHSELLPEEDLTRTRAAYAAAAAFVDDAASVGSTAAVILGATLKRSHFQLDPSWCFVNHGAFGGALLPGTEIKHTFTEFMERNPATFFQSTLFPCLKTSRDRFADFVSAEPDDLFLVENVTVGMNAAVRAAVVSTDDVVVMLDSGYPSTYKIVHERCKQIQNVNRRKFKNGTCNSFSHPNCTGSTCSYNSNNNSFVVGCESPENEKSSTQPPQSQSQSQQHHHLKCSNNSHNNGQNSNNNSIATTSDATSSNYLPACIDAHMVSGPTHASVSILKHIEAPEVLGDAATLTEYLRSCIPDGVTVMILEHMSSGSAIALPLFTHIIPMLWASKPRLRHIIVDGAHGPIQFDLNMNAIFAHQRPTLYVGNLHKWFALPKAAGFLWVPSSTPNASKEESKRCHDAIDVQLATHSTVVDTVDAAPRVKVDEKRAVSLQYQLSSGFSSEHIWSGTNDFGARLAIPAIVDFWRTVVPAAVARAYCSQLLDEAEGMLCEAFRVDRVPSCVAGTFMRLVQLPSFFKRQRFSPKYLQDRLYSEFGVECPIKDLHPYGADVLYLRVSTFINNTMPDYVRLRDAILSMSNMRRKREFDDDEAEDEHDDSGPGGCRRRRIDNMCHQVPASDEEDEEEGEQEEHDVDVCDVDNACNERHSAAPCIHNNSTIGSPKAPGCSSIANMPSKVSSFSDSDDEE